MRKPCVFYYVRGSTVLVLGLKDEQIPLYLRLPSNQVLSMHEKIFFSNCKLQFTVRRSKKYHCACEHEAHHKDLRHIIKT